MKVWVSRYALSTGVYEVKVKETSSPGYVCGDGWKEDFFGEGRQWHRTKEGAIAKAEEMRLAKIKSLQKQIEKLEKLKF